MEKIDLKMECFTSHGIGGDSLLLQSKTMVLDNMASTCMFMISITNLSERWFVISFVENDSDEFSAGYNTSDAGDVIELIYTNISKQLQIVNGVGYELEYAKLKDSIISINVNITKDGVGNRYLTLQVYQTEIMKMSETEENRLIEAIKQCEKDFPEEDGGEDAIS